MLNPRLRHRGLGGRIGRKLWTGLAASFLEIHIEGVGLTVRPRVSRSINPSENQPELRLRILIGHNVLEATDDRSDERPTSCDTDAILAVGAMVTGARIHRGDSDRKIRFHVLPDLDDLVLLGRPRLFYWSGGCLESDVLPSYGRIVKLPDNEVNKLGLLDKLPEIRHTLYLPCRNLFLFQQADLGKAP